MGLLDSVVSSLPKFTAGDNVVSNAVSYVTAPIGSLLSEAGSKVQSTFGNILGQTPFGKIASAATTKISLTTPTTASAADIRAAVGNGVDPTNDSYKVQLWTTDGEEGIIFDVSPQIGENRAVNYTELETPQMIGAFQKYTGTKTTEWTITGKMICRTIDEATQNYDYLNTARGWTQTYFGAKQLKLQSGTSTKNRKYLGSPPPTLLFSGWRGLVGTVPVVMTTFSVTWPIDVDWIQTAEMEKDSGQPIPFPTVIDFNINVRESFSADQFNSFDLEAFKNGDMVGAFSGNGFEVNTGEGEGAAGGDGGFGGTENFPPGTEKPEDPNQSNAETARLNRQEATAATAQSTAVVEKQKTDLVNRIQSDTKILANSAAKLTSLQSQLDFAQAQVNSGESTDFSTVQNLQAQVDSQRAAVTAHQNRINASEAALTKLGGSASDPAGYGNG